MALKANVLDFKSTNEEKEDLIWGEFYMLEVDNLNVPKEYQRDFNARTYKRLFDKFNPKSFDPLAVAIRPDGKYYIVDGQHRWAVAKAKGNQTVPCMVFLYDGPIDEAKVFVERQKNRLPMKSNDEYKARLTAKDPVALKIRDIVSDCNMQISGSCTSKIPRNINAVGSLFRIFTAHGVEVLRETLYAIDLGLGGEHEGLKQPVLIGLAQFISRYRKDPNYKLKELIRKMAMVQPIKFYRDAAAKAKVLNWSIPASMALAFLHIYNFKRKVASKLSPKNIIDDATVEPTTKTNKLGL